MKKTILIPLLLIALFGYSQEDTAKIYKKRVLETAEVDFLASFYTQNGNHASVTGGIGTEELINAAPSIVISIPLNDDDVLTIDAGVSAYTSASSSNLNPFNKSHNNGDETPPINPDINVEGSPWAEASGASKTDGLVSASVNYSHSSDSRNDIFDVNVSFSSEYDYISFGFGGGFTKLFNEKNTEIGIKGNVFIDSWNPVYPVELDVYRSNSNLDLGFFTGIDIYNQSGSIADKNSANIWKPVNTTLVSDEARNTFSVSLSLSQILSENAQFSFFFDVVKQEGWLSNPMQRVYFADKDNYYVGNPASIPNYTSPENSNVFQLADDIERLPSSRLKFPIGARFHYYINERFVLRTYYRYYFDDWGVSSHTASIEIPIKIGDKFTIYPSYRFYNQTAADYFAPFDQHLSSNEFYTSDYDLSEFNSNQFSFGITYTDIFTERHIWKFGLKSIDLNYSHYSRNINFNANIITAGIKFVID